MMIKIPNFLLEMSKQLNEQDNRMTVEPIFEVRHKDYLVTDEGFDEDHWVLYHPDCEGRPTYSTKNGYENDDCHIEFYEVNEDWCNKWLFDGGHDENPIEFRDNFDFEEHKNNHNYWPDEYYVVHLQEIEKTIKCCLTEHDAKAFIARKQHDYPNLYTYVNSMVFCPQMIELRKWIMELSNDD